MTVNLLPIVCFILILVGMYMVVACLFMMKMNEEFAFKLNKYGLMLVLMGMLGFILGLIFDL